MNKMDLVDKIADTAESDQGVCGQSTGRHGRCNYERAARRRSGVSDRIWHFPGKESTGTSGAQSPDWCDHHYQVSSGSQFPCRQSLKGVRKLKASGTGELPS